MLPLSALSALGCSQWRRSGRRLWLSSRLVSIRRRRRRLVLVVLADLLLLRAPGRSWWCRVPLSALGRHKADTAIWVV